MWSRRESNNMYFVNNLKAILFNFLGKLLYLFILNITSKYIKKRIH